jgi:hypothetical protein
MDVANGKPGDDGLDLTKVRDLRNVLLAPRETGRRKAPGTGGGPMPLSEFRSKAPERTGRVWVTPMDGMQDASRWPARDGDSSAGTLIFWIFADSGVDIAAGDGKLDGLPRIGSDRIFDGVCPFLENSTVC